MAANKEFHKNIWRIIDIVCTASFIGATLLLLWKILAGDIPIVCRNAGVILSVTWGVCFIIISVYKTFKEDI